MKKKSKFFYSSSQLGEMREAIDNRTKPSIFAKQKSKEWDRPHTAIIEKMRKLSHGWSSEGKIRKHYSPAQEQLLKHAIFRGDKFVDIVNRYAEEWNRGKPGLYAKVTELKKKMTLGKEETRKTTINIPSPKEENGIILPKGFKFEGDSKKVMLYSDHFRVYF